MRILLLIFTFNAIAAFNPIPTAPVTTYGLPVISKGSLVTSNGSSLGESTVCGDGKILEWLASDDDGVVCVDSPVDTNAGTKCSSGQLLNGDGLCEAIPSGDTNIAASAGPTNGSVGGTLNVLLGNRVTLNVVSGKKYMFTFSAERLDTSDTIRMNINGVEYVNVSPLGDTRPFTAHFLWTSNVTGSVNFDIYGRNWTNVTDGYSIVTGAY